MLTPPCTPAADAPEYLQANQFLFQTSQKLGCTRLHPGTTLGPAAASRAVTGKLIPKDDMAEFLAKEGRALFIAHNFPHPSLPSMVKTIENADGSGVVVLGALGQDLHSYVRTHTRLSESEAKRLFRQIVDCVAHCHRHQIVLRDIKLGKLFFSAADSSRVVFAELDGAQVVDEENPWLLDQKGSPAYVSPEVLGFQPYDGAAADVWALGVVLYVMLTGTYPFQDHRPAGLFQKIQRAASGVYFPEHLSVGAHQLICRILQRDPRSRPTAKEILADPWFQPDSPRSLRRNLPVPPEPASEPVTLSMEQIVPTLEFSACQFLCEPPSSPLSNPQTVFRQRFKRELSCDDADEMAALDADASGQSSNCKPSRRRLSYDDASPNTSTHSPLVVQ